MNPAYFNVFITNGRPGCTYDLLSVAETYVLVDLYYVDDGSGRQQWQPVPVIPS